MSNAMLELKDAFKIYNKGSKEVRAVNGVSLEVKKGESLAVVGPSGAGKSTLLHLMGGLDSPTRGRVVLDDTDIYCLSDRERARIRNSRIGFVFQFYHLLPEFTAIENVMIPALIKGRNTRKEAAELLRSIGLGHRMDHRPSELSGGESQRVAIARALINDPEFLLCDEPTGNLDSKTRDDVHELLFEVKRKKRSALVVVTHDETISKKFDRTVRLKDGKIA